MVIWVQREAVYFCERDWTGRLGDLPDRQHNQLWRLMGRGSCVASHAGTTGHAGGGNEIKRKCRDSINRVFLRRRARDHHQSHHPAQQRQPNHPGEGGRGVFAMQSAQGHLIPWRARMFPRQAPFEPTVYQLHRNRRSLPPNYLHDSWLDYLYWDKELNP
jgi:hypothetical protein